MTSDFSPMPVQWCDMTVKFSPVKKAVRYSRNIWRKQKSFLRGKYFTKSHEPRHCINPLKNPIWIGKISRCVTHGNVDWQKDYSALSTGVVRSKRFHEPTITTGQLITPFLSCNLSKNAIN